MILDTSHTTHAFANTTTYLDNDGQRMDDRCKKTPKRRRTTSLGHLVCLFHCFFFIVLTFYFRYVLLHSFSDIRRVFDDDGQDNDRGQWATTYLDNDGQRMDDRRKKRPRDVVRRLLGIWYVFSLFLFYCTNFLF